MLPVITLFVGPTINPTGARFTTGTGLSESIFYLLNRTTGKWCAPYFDNDECDDKDNYVYALYK